MKHRWTILPVFSIIALFHNAAGAVYRKGLDNNGQPQRKPSLSCVLFYGDGLCSFKCRLFGQGAEGHCENKSCVCKHDGETYIEGENGFELLPKPKDLVSSRSMSNSGISSYKPSDSPLPNIEFTAEEDQLRLKLMTFLVFQSKQGQDVDVCKFLRDNNIDVEDLRRLNEEEKFRNKQLHSRSPSTSESDNLGAMVLKMIPNGCPRIRSPKTQTRHQPIKKRTDSGMDDLAALQARLDSIPTRRSSPASHSYRPSQNDHSNSMKIGPDDGNEGNSSINRKSLPWYPGERRRYRPPSGTSNIESEYPQRETSQSDDDDSPVSSTHRGFATPDAHVPKAYPSQQRGDPSPSHSIRGGNITPKAHSNPTKRQFSLSANPLSPQSMRVKTPSYKKSNIPSSKPTPKRKIVDKPGRYSFMSPLKHNTASKLNSKSPRGQQPNVASMPPYMVQPADVEILPQKSKEKPLTVSSSAIHPTKKLRVSAKPMRNMRKPSPPRIPAMKSGFKPVKLGAPVLKPSKIIPEKTKDEYSEPNDTGGEKSIGSDASAPKKLSKSEKVGIKPPEIPDSDGVKEPANATDEKQHDNVENNEVHSTHPTGKDMDEVNPSTEPAVEIPLADNMHLPSQTDTLESSPVEMTGPQLSEMPEMSGTVKGLNEPEEDSTQTPDIESTPQDLQTNETPKGSSDSLDPHRPEVVESLSPSNLLSNETPEDPSVDVKSESALPSAQIDDAQTGPSDDTDGDSVYELKPINQENQTNEATEPNVTSEETPEPKSEAGKMTSSGIQDEVKPTGGNDEIGDQTGSTPEPETKLDKTPKSTPEIELKNDGDAESRPIKETDENGTASAHASKAPHETQIEHTPVPSNSLEENREPYHEDLSKPIEKPNEESNESEQEQPNAPESSEPAQTDNPEHPDVDHEIQPEAVKDSEALKGPVSHEAINDEPTPPETGSRKEVDPDAEPKREPNSPPDESKISPEVPSMEVERNPRTESTPETSSDSNGGNEQKSEPSGASEAEKGSSRPQMGPVPEDSSSVENPDNAVKTDNLGIEPTDETPESPAVPEETIPSERVDDSQPSALEQADQKTETNLPTKSDIESKSEIENTSEDTASAPEINPIEAESETMTSQDKAVNLEDSQPSEKTEILEPEPIHEPAEDETPKSLAAPEETKPSERVDDSQSSSLEQADQETEPNLLIKPDIEFKPEKENMPEDTTSAPEIKPIEAESETMDSQDKGVNVEDSQPSEKTEALEPEPIHEPAEDETPKSLAAPEETNPLEIVDDSQDSALEQADQETEPNLLIKPDIEFKPEKENMPEDTTSAPEIKPIENATEAMDSQDEAVVLEDSKPPEKTEALEPEPMHEPAKGEHVLGEFEDDDPQEEANSQPSEANHLESASTKEPGSHESGNKPITPGTQEEIPYKPESLSKSEGGEIEPKPECESKPVNNDLPNNSDSETESHSETNDATKGDSNAKPESKEEFKPPENDDDSKSVTDGGQTVLHDDDESPHPEGSLSPPLEINQPQPESMEKPKVLDAEELSPSEQALETPKESPEQGNEQTHLNTQEARPGRPEGSSESEKRETEPVPEKESETVTENLTDNFGSVQESSPDNNEAGKGDPEKKLKSVEDSKLPENPDDINLELEEGEKILEEYDDDDPYPDGADPAQTTFTDPMKESLIPNRKSNEQSQPNSENSLKPDGTSDKKANILDAENNPRENIPTQEPHDEPNAAPKLQSASNQKPSQPEEENSQVESNDKSLEASPLQSDTKPETQSDGTTNAAAPEPDESEQIIGEYEDDDGSPERSPDVAINSNPQDSNLEDGVVPSDPPMRTSKDSPKQDTTDIKNSEDNVVEKQITDADQPTNQKNAEEKSQVMKSSEPEAKTPPASTASSENDHEKKLNEKTTYVEPKTDQNTDGSIGDETPSMDGDKDSSADNVDQAQNIPESTVEDEHPSSESEMPTPEDEGEHVMEEFEDEEEPEHGIASKSLPTFPGLSDENNTGTSAPATDAPQHIDMPSKSDAEVNPETSNQSKTADSQPEQNASNTSESIDSTPVAEAPLNSAPSNNEDPETTSHKPDLSPESNMKSEGTNRKDELPSNKKETAAPENQTEDLKNPKDLKPVTDDEDEKEHVLDEYEDDDSMIGDDHPMEHSASSSSEAQKNEDTTPVDAIAPTINAHDDKTTHDENKETKSHTEPDTLEHDDSEKVLEEFTDDDHPDVSDEHDSGSEDKIIKDYIIDEVAIEHEDE